MVPGIPTATAQKNGDVAESAIDHIYYSQTIKNIECKKLTQSSTDHLPILCEIRFKKPAARFVHEIRKRSYKTYTINYLSNSPRKA